MSVKVEKIEPELGTKTVLVGNSFVPLPPDARSIPRIHLLGHKAEDGKTLGADYFNLSYFGAIDRTKHPGVDKRTQTLPWKEWRKIALQTWKDSDLVNKNALDWSSVSLLSESADDKLFFGYRVQLLTLRSPVAVNSLRTKKSSPRIFSFDVESIKKVYVAEDRNDVDAAMRVTGSWVMNRDDLTLAKNILWFLHKSAEKIIQQ